MEKWLQVESNLPVTYYENSGNVMVRRNDFLHGHAHLIGGASCDIHYDVTYSPHDRATDRSEQLPIGHVAVVEWTLRPNYTPQDVFEKVVYSGGNLYKALVGEGAEDKDKVAHLNLFYPLWNAGVQQKVEGEAGMYRRYRDIDRGLVEKFIPPVMDDVLTDLKSQGFSWVYFGTLTDFELAQTRGLEKRHNFKTGTSHYGPPWYARYGPPWYADLRNLALDTRLTPHDTNHIIDFALGKPNLNLGLVQISDLYKRLTKLDLDALAESLGIETGKVIGFLSERLVSALVRNDFQKSTQTALETVERLKRKLGE